MSTMTWADTLRLALGIAEKRDALKSTTNTQAATIAVLELKASGLDRIVTASGRALTLSRRWCVTTSTTIALRTQVEHRAVLQLIRTHLPKIERFGGVAFEMRPLQTAGGEQTREIALLNERQATLLLAFMRNSPIVAKFKFNLVNAFFGMAHKLRDGLRKYPYGICIGRGGSRWFRQSDPPTLRHPPAEPGGLKREPLKAAGRGR